MSKDFRGSSLMRLESDVCCNKNKAALATSDELYSRPYEPQSAGERSSCRNKTTTAMFDGFATV